VIPPFLLRAIDSDLTVTGANSGERGEAWDLSIQLKQAVFETAANSGERKETDSGSVSPGSNPGPAALENTSFAGKTQEYEQAAFLEP
jgi:hypothetical protein